MGSLEEMEPVPEPVEVTESVGETPLQPALEPAVDPGLDAPAMEAPEPDVPVFSGPPPKFVGNITTGSAVDTNGLVYSDYWDQITPENAGKWGSVQATAASAPNYAALDAIYDYTQRKGIIFKEHTFLWGPQQPSGDITPADVQSWMRGFCTRYPNTRLIDVVNEPPPHQEPRYADAIGGGTNGNWQWIVNAFIWAREACPNATLILNDYNNIEFADQTQHFIDIVKVLQAQGAPIDAVGAQAHGLSGANSTRTMIPLLTKLHDDTGLPVYITEYDINQADDAAQLARFQEHFAFFLDTEWVRGVTVWGWILGRTWVPNSGLIRNGEPRPAMVWLMQELERPVPQ
jgi:endo-1,4-beta-xylanase